jgi:hypothetical protein
MTVLDKVFYPEHFIFKVERFIRDGGAGWLCESNPFHKSLQTHHCLTPREWQLTKRASRSLQVETASDGEG